MNSYETEFNGTFITVWKNLGGLDMALTYPDGEWTIEDQANVDELFNKVFDSIEAGETLTRAIRLTSAVIVRVKKAVA